MKCSVDTMCSNTHLEKVNNQVFCFNCYGLYESGIKKKTLEKNQCCNDPNIIKTPIQDICRKNCLNKKYNLNNRIILFLDESFENIRKHLRLKRFPISKYLNTVYEFYCIIGDIHYIPLNNSKILKLDDNISQILNEAYIKYPYIKIEKPLYAFDVDYL